MIRRARRDDADSIATVFARSFGTLEFLPVLHTPDEDRAFLQLVLETQDVWVAERTRRILGFAALDGDLCTLLYVDPGVHRTGVGSALFAQLCEARPDGFRFWTFQANENARGFYERRGCRAIEFTDGRGNEEKVPDVLYEWRPKRPASRDEVAGIA